MANLEFSNCRIAGIATSVPKIVRKTVDFTDWLGEDGVQKIIKNVGIKQGHITEEHETTSDLCLDAAEKLLNELDVDKNSIDVLLFVSQTPDYIAPSTACLLQHRLGLSDDCLAFDINLACSGYVYGLTVAKSYLSNPSINNVLLLAGDTVSKHCSPQDKTLSILSTDAGSATFLVKDDNAPKSYYKLKTIGKGYRNLIVPYGGYRHREGSFERTFREEGVYRNDFDGYMNGAEVFKFSITEVPKLIKSFNEELGRALYNKYFLHQANLFIINNITKRIKAPQQDVPVSIDRYGNTGAATIPLTICDAYGGQNTLELESVLVCGFGIGLSLGVGALSLSGTKVLPISVSNIMFEDDVDSLHSETVPLVR